MKVLRARSGEEIAAFWTETLKRLIRRYWERRIKRRSLRRGNAENEIMTPYEGRRWCDATERELLDEIMNGRRSHF